MGRPSKAEQQARRTAEGAAGGHGMATHPRIAPSPSDGQSAGVSAQLPGPPPPRTGTAGDSTFDPLLTIDQLAQWLGKPKGTLYQWRCRNMGPRGIKVGNDVRYRRSEVEAYLEANTDKRSSA